MSRISPFKYTFAVAKIKVLENFLISKETFQQAAESEISDAVKRFVDEGLYTDRLLHVANSDDLEEILNEEKGKLIGLISELLHDKRLLPLLELESLEKIISVLDQHPSSFLDDYIRHLIDMHNIKTFLRLYAVQDTKDRLETLLVDRGFLNKQLILDHYDLDLAPWIQSLKHINKHGQIIDYSLFFLESIEKVNKEFSFYSLEKRINDFMIELLKPIKYYVFGPEPLLAYFWGKTNEMNLIRLVILAKFNLLTIQQVKERLNDVYA